MNIVAYILAFVAGTLLLSLAVVLFNFFSEKKLNKATKVFLFIDAAIFSYMISFGTANSLSAEVLIVSKDHNQVPVYSKEKVFFEYTTARGENVKVGKGNFYIDNTLTDSLELITVIYKNEKAPESYRKYEDKRILIPGKSFMEIPEPDYLFEEPPVQKYIQKDVVEDYVWYLKPYRTEEPDSI